MAIQLVSAQFVQSYNRAQPGDELRAPFAPLIQGLGTGPVNPKATAASPGETPTTPAVLVSSLIRPRILLENPCPLQVEVVLRATAGEGSARVTVKSSLPSLGGAQASQGFPDSQTVSLTLEFDDAKPSAVADETVTLFWEFESSGVVETAKTSHRLLITLGAPRSPWGMDPNQQSQWIWQEVVELACKWASGAQSNDEAARLISAAVFGLGNEPEASGLRYGGFTQYCQANTFDCAGFLRHLKADPSTVAGSCVTAQALATFAS